MESKHTMKSSMDTLWHQCFDMAINLEHVYKCPVDADNIKRAASKFYHANDRTMLEQTVNSALMAKAVFMRMEIEQLRSVNTDMLRALQMTREFLNAIGECQPEQLEDTISSLSEALEDDIEAAIAKAENS